MKKQSGKAKTRPQTGDLVPAPHNLLYQPHDPEGDRLALDLSLAGEALAAPLRPERAESLRPRHAIPEGASLAPPDFTGLVDIVGKSTRFLPGTPNWRP